MRPGGISLVTLVSLNQLPGFVCLLRHRLQQQMAFLPFSKCSCGSWIVGASLSAHVGREALA